MSNNNSGLSIKKGGNRFLNGMPFIAAEVNWADEYEKYLKKGGTPGSYQPTEGIIPRTCEFCFFRGEMTEIGPSGKGDCHCGAMGNLAKVLFRIGGGVMPKKIDQQQVGNYCPNWTDFRAE